MGDSDWKELVDYADTQQRLNQTHEVTKKDFHLKVSQQPDMAAPLIEERGKSTALEETVKDLDRMLREIKEIECCPTAAEEVVLPL